MKVFKRELIHTHYPGPHRPDFLGEVALGESFVVETEWDGKMSGVNGPVAISGVTAGDVIAVHIEDIEILPPYEAPNGGPFFEGMGPPVPLEYRDGYFYFPRYFRLKASPSVGNIAVLPEFTPEIEEICSEIIIDDGRTRIKHDQGWRFAVYAPRGKHCHQDCAFLARGSIIHMKTQVDKAGLCVADVHGYIGQGEMAFAGIEVSANVRLRAEKSKGWLVDWPVIETEDEIMVFVSYTSTFYRHPKQKYVDVVREAYRALREVVAARIGGGIEDANPIVAAAADLRNCALYGLGEGYIPQHENVAPFDIAVVACLPKDIFIS